MDTNSFTSGPIRPLSSQELGANRFTDYELLSDSGHNLIYRAQMGGKWVVLKAAKPTEGERTRNQLLLEREFEIMHRLDSIYVVQAISMVDDPQLGRAILMEYVHGRSLDKFVAENPSSTERRRVADELMEALIFLHDRQIVHGDLKPSNILITDYGNHVRLIDFGFADNEAYIAKNIGTSPSISTEEQLPTDVLLPERDIYALGKMLALLFPHSAKPIIRRCLASDRSRYTSVRQVRAALHRYWRLRWLLPLALALATIMAFVIVFQPSPKETVQPIEIQTDTVVVIVPAKPVVDSTWLNLKSKTDKRYSALYRTYADSLKNMPVKYLNEGILMNGRYATKVWKVYNQAATSYPQYAEQLYDQYLFIYDRDSKSLADIYKDYQVYVININGDTVIVQQKPLAE
jgi:serine/threonine-protein kinase